VASERRLGQGLALLLGETRVSDVATTTSALLEIPLDRIEPNPRQPRSRLDEAAFAELVDSVRRDGIVQPVVVRRVGSTWQLIAGERRWRAATAAGLATIPAVERVADDREALALALVENLVRSDLNAIETARAYVRLIEEFGLSQTALAEAVGRGRVSVANTLRLLDLPDEVLAAIERGELSEGHGRAILAVAGHDERRALGRLAVDRGLSVRATEAAARKAGTAASAPRPRREPGRYDGELANDVVDGLYRLLGVPARVVPQAEGCRIEIAIATGAELATLVMRLDELGA
jgi:ParB family transcriptional regulator, chromosome partitioning protein